MAIRNLFDQSRHPRQVDLVRALKAGQVFVDDVNQLEARLQIRRIVFNQLADGFTDKLGAAQIDLLQMIDRFLHVRRRGEDKHSHSNGIVFWPFFEKLLVRLQRQFMTIQYLTCDAVLSQLQCVTGFAWIDLGQHSFLQPMRSN